MKDLGLIVRTAKSADICANVIAKMVASVSPDVVKPTNPLRLNLSLSFNRVGLQQAQVVITAHGSDLLGIEVEILILNIENVLVRSQVEVEAHRNRIDISTTEGITYTGVLVEYAQNVKGNTMPSPDREEKKKVLDQKLIKRSRGALQEYLEIVLAKRRKKDNG
jgi:hypothetical protein